MNVQDTQEQLGGWKKKARQNIALYTEEIDETTDRNTERLLTLFREHNVGAFHFTPSTGYGYDDLGREKLDSLYAGVFGTETAFVRSQFISGTHAITAALFGVLRPGDELLYGTGMPYDTLRTVIGIEGEAEGTLQEWGITYKESPYEAGGELSADRILSHVTDATKVIAIQRSRGYAERESVPMEKMKQVIAAIKQKTPDVIVFVDNCYGEFTETSEPGHAGADLMAGSLIKNPGGGIVKTGGYIAGRKDLIEKAASRFAAPGIGMEGGPTLYSLQEMFQGLFLAPHVVGEALKGSLYTAALLEEAGLQTTPSYTEKRTDLIQSVTFASKEQMVTFCQAIQEASPVDARVIPQPAYMPGYTSDVIMAAGTFIQGASIELSADGPIRPPYTAYVQGGLTFSHVKIAVEHAVTRLLEKELLASFR